MNRLIRIGILWCLAISIASAQETAIPKDQGNPSPAAAIEPAEEPLPSAPKSIVLLIDADAQQSEVVKQVVEALEKAGTAKSQAAETTPPASSLISVTLSMRKDESYEKIKILIEALKDSGVHQISLKAGVEAEGEEQNVLTLHLHPGYTFEEFRRIENSVQMAVKQCGIRLFTAVTGREKTDAGTFFTPPEQEPETQRRPINANSLTSDSSTEGYSPFPRQPQPAAKTVKVFTLKHAQAIDAAEVLTQVYDKGPSKIIPDVRTNSVIVTGPEAQVQEIEALLLKLDEVESAANTRANLPAPVVPIENEAATLVVQWEDELAQLKQLVGPDHPKVKGLQARIEMARKTAANSTIKDADPFSPNDAVQWNLMASEIATELKKDQEAFSRLHGTNGGRVNYFDEAIDGFKVLHGDRVFGYETGIARFSAECKMKYQPLIEKGADALRAERDRLIETNFSENDVKIVELELLTAWATVQERYRDRGISAQHGVGAAATEDAVRVIEGSPRELQQQLAQLLNDYEAANTQAYNLAESLRQTPDAAKKSELRTAVQRAFTARQSLLRAELQEMQTRLEKTQQSLEMRDRIADQIVDRRVEDLLNPELKWDNASRSEFHEQASSAPKYQLLGFRFARDTAKKSDTIEAFMKPNITAIIPGSAAEASGFLPGDQVFAVNGLYTWGIDEFVQVIDRQSTGSVECMVRRENRSITLELQIPPEIAATPLANAAQREDSRNTRMVAPVTELEGDWHRVGASVDQTGAETPHFNITIHGNTWTKFFDQKTEAIEFLCDATKKTIEFKSTPTLVYTYEMHGDTFILKNETQSQAFDRGHRLQPDELTELEGDWHQVSATDKDGKPLTVRPVNMSFKKDRYTFAYQGGQHDRRVEVFADKKEIRYFQEGEYNGFVQDHYLLEGDQLTIYDENRRNVFQRGHVALPKSIPAATDEQKSLWRSGIVEIIAQHRQNNAELQEPKRYGVVVSPQGLIVSQLRSSDGDWLYFARFDDGGLIPIKLGEEGIQGWAVFQPQQPIEVNHHYGLSAAAVGKDDEVNFWGRAATVSETPTLELFKTTVNDLDRKAPALGQSVWQLVRHDKLDGSLPVLDSNGDLLAITIAGTNELLLAIPVSQLKTMFPKSFGPAAQVAE